MCVLQVQLMTPDDFPDVTPTNRYHMQRPKEAFGSMAEASLGSSEEADEEVQPTMQLRCELQILNTGGSCFATVAIIDTNQHLHQTLHIIAAC